MINIIPTPKVCTAVENARVKLKNAIYTDNRYWVIYCESFANDFEHITGCLPEYGKGGIELKLDKEIRADGYVIDCSETGITASASTNDGILYALASLLQLVEADGDNMICPKVYIEDYPDKEYRSIMIDLGREWHPADTLYKYVDICYLYKVKYLHLHFCDTNLYTLPSKAFPKLNTEGRFYSYDEIEALNLYAMHRGVVIIPEFECPGHAPVLVRNYPEVFGDKFENEVSSDYTDENGLAIATDTLMCAGSEACFEATKTLIKEMCDLFPDSPYINIGGDEASIKLWNSCSECKKYMTEHGIKDEHELYSDYIARITSYVFTLGKTPIVWEGFPKDGADKVPKDTIVIAWESLYHLAPDLLEAGFRVINASWQPLYIVPWRQTQKHWNGLDILKWNVYNWQNWWSKSKAFLNPINVAPTDNVLGSMLCSWQQTYEQEIGSVMENLAAVSERTWTVERVCSDEEYNTKMNSVIMKAARLLQDW